MLDMEWGIGTLRLGGTLEKMKTKTTLLSMLPILIRKRYYTPITTTQTRLGWAQKLIYFPVLFSSPSSTP